jgi:hypothetical protein
MSRTMSRNDSTPKRQAGGSTKPPAATRTFDSAARLGGYLTVGLGAGILGTSQAEAGIVTIDIGPGGFNIGGVNAGVSSGNYTSRSDFPVTGAGTLFLYNKYVYVGEANYTQTGLGGYTSGLGFAYVPPGRPVNFSAGSLIDGTSSFSGYGGLFYFREDSLTPSVSPDFNAGSYVGFKTSQGNFGWLEVTWSGSLQQFQIFSGAYEDVAGVAIKAGDTGTPVPEIDPSSFGSALSLVMGSLAMLEHRRRKREESVADATVA